MCASASSIEQFCTDHSISRPLLYKLWAAGNGPRQMRVGRKVLISAEAAAEWRRACEQESKAQAA